jgi:hypothetical protein
LIRAGSGVLRPKIPLPAVLFFLWRRQTRPYNSAMTKTYALPAVLGCILMVGSLATAQPKKNVSAARHPNLAAAQQLSHQAWEKVLAAQKANEWDMQGHAQKAKDLLDQVNSELKLAAEAANK